MSFICLIYVFAFTVNYKNVCSRFVKKSFKSYRLKLVKHQQVKKYTSLKCRQNKLIVIFWDVHLAEKSLIKAEKNSPHRRGGNFIPEFCRMSK